MSGIDCRQAETLVARYIKHTLSTDELEEFLDHIEHCSSCYDELETYFIFVCDFFYGSSDRGCIICCISCNGSNALFIT